VRRDRHRTLRGAKKKGAQRGTRVPGKRRERRKGGPCEASFLVFSKTPQGRKRLQKAMHSVGRRGSVGRSKGGGVYKGKGRRHVKRMRRQKRLATRKRSPPRESLDRMIKCTGGRYRKGPPAELLPYKRESPKGRGVEEVPYVWVRRTKDFSLPGKKMSVKRPG